LRVKGEGAMGHLERLICVMGDQDCCGGGLSKCPNHIVHKCVMGDRVETREGFIEQKHPWRRG
jgi:hypothetical protein